MNEDEQKLNFEKFMNALQTFVNQVTLFIKDQCEFNEKIVKDICELKDKINK